MARYALDGEIAKTLLSAVQRISTSPNTRDAYWVDARHWLRFCELQGVEAIFLRTKDRKKRAALLDAVVLWIDAMRSAGTASKSRTRRVAALSSIYDELRRADPDLWNPFSAKDGPRRERAIRERPTPAVEPDLVSALLAACRRDRTFEGRRDEALLRLLWATGIRRSSAVALTRERLIEDGNAYLAELPVKGSRTVRILIKGHAATALRTVLETLPPTGPVFRRKSGVAMAPREVWLVVHRRAKEAGIEKRISPHSFRASFLTYGEAGLEARQDAAGHADASTTKLYDRRSWRGKEAFEKMPEVESFVQRVPFTVYEGGKKEGDGDE